MKTKIIAILMSMVVLMSCTISASATVFTPSAENKVAPTITVHTEKVGDYEVQDLDLRVEIMTEDYSDEYFAEEFDLAIETVEAATDIEDIVGSTGMLSPQVACLYYVVISEDLKAALDANPDVLLEVTLENVGISSGVTVLGYVFKNNEWSSCSTTNNNNNSVTVISHFCPLMLVVDTAVVESPETSDQFINIFAIAAFVCLAIAGGFLAASKIKRKAR